MQVNFRQLPRTFVRGLLLFLIAILASGFWLLTSSAQATSLIVSNISVSAVSNAATFVVAVVSTNGLDSLPDVRLYLSTVDNGVNSNLWPFSVDLGANDVSQITSMIYGLRSLKDYYFTCSATTTGGTAWASSSYQFRTPLAGVSSPGSPVIIQTNQGDQIVTRDLNINRNLDVAGKASANTLSNVASASITNLTAGAASVNTLSNVTSGYMTNIGSANITNAGNIIVTGTGTWGGSLATGILNNASVSGAFYRVGKTWMTNGLAPPNGGTFTVPVFY